MNTGNNYGIMFTAVKNNKVYLSILIGIALFAVSVNIIYVSSGYRMIEALYTKSAIGPFNNLIQGQSFYSLDQYVAKITSTVEGLNFFLVLLFLGLTVIFYGLKYGSALKIFACFLWADICFLVLHFSHGGFWSFNTDWYLPEMFQYIKELCVVVVSFFLFMNTKKMVFGWSTGLFSYLLLDDSLSIHERCGSFLSRNIDFSTIIDSIGSRGQDLGELIFLALIGIVLMSFFLVVFLRSQPYFRRISLLLLGLVFFLVFFGIVVDFARSFSALARFDRFLTVLEEFGEMVAMSFVCFFIFKIYIEQKAKTGALK